MALQEFCDYTEDKVKSGGMSLFGNMTGLNYSFPLSPFKFYTPAAEYLEESPLQFGQVSSTQQSSGDLLPPHWSDLSSISSPSSLSVPLPFPMAHGTTTLAFIFRGGVLAAADTRSSCSGLVACPAAQKILPIHSHLVGTTSGTSADCALWKRILARELRLYQLRHGRRLSTRGAAKLLSHMLHPFKGTELCVAATLCGWDGGEQVAERSGENLDSLECKEVTESIQKYADASMDETQSTFSNEQLSFTKTSFSGPSLFYVCSDGTRLQGSLFSVGSGSPYAYSILDQGVKWGLTVEEAISIAREAVYRATHRDAYSGNCVDVYHISSTGWVRRQREDLREEYYKEKEKRRKGVLDGARRDCA